MPVAAGPQIQIGPNHWRLDYAAPGREGKEENRWGKQQRLCRTSGARRHGRRKLREPTEKDGRPPHPRATMQKCEMKRVTRGACQKLLKTKRQICKGLRKGVRGT